MNKYFKWSLALLVITAAGCSDDQEPKTPEITPGTSGDEVVFTFGDPKSRTTYAEPWAESGKQDIYWGNYLTADPEQIKIYCRESHGNIATYNVTPEAGSSDAASISKAKEDVAIRWGAQGAYEFCAFYPANQAGDAFVGESGHVIQARIVSGQSPKIYKTKGSDNNLTTESLENIAKNTATVSKDPVIIYGMPDMEAAIMMAKTTMTAEEYGNPVGLDFNVLADVLDLTINGPVQPNYLNGNENPEDGRTHINIQNVKIKAKDGRTVLAGSFNLDMDNRTVTPLTNATSEIMVITSDGTGQNVTLQARVNEAANVDKLHLRIFLMPGQVTNLNQLTVTVGTDCGDYEQNLKDFGMASEMVSGKIYNVKLPYFNRRGTKFDFSRWIGQLDKNIYISELSIPGTWHSSNTNNQGSATLQEQYDAGIRAFEVHTINGTEPKTYGDLTKDFDINSAEFETTPINEKEDELAYVATGGDNFEPGAVTGTGNSRSVTAENLTVTVTKTSSYQLRPKFSLRLYRTRNVSSPTSNPSSSLSDALIDLSEKMNKTGFMIFEFGYDNYLLGNRNVDIQVKTVVEERTVTLTGLKLSGTQIKQGTSWEDPNASNVEWNYASLNLNDVTWSEPRINQDTDSKITIAGQEAWAIAVETCLNRLANTTNTTTEKTVLYTKEVTANTTIGDVQGQVIAKVNTNGDGNEKYGWSGNTPALFSRWIGDSGKEPKTINLKWGKPVEPSPLTSDLHWCFTELEQVSSIQDRKDAIDVFGDISYQNYVGGLHRTFYEIAIGGYLSSNNATGCQNLAKELNPYLLNVLSDPTQKPCPYGIVFMNYAIPPTGQENTYKSADLIRTIINNNAAFTLQRRGSEATPEVEEKTNSSFNANPSSPIK